MVAAWMSADTGVGPSIASGNQMCNGNMALLPAPPMKMQVIAQHKTEQPRNVVPCIVARAELEPLMSVSKSNVLV